MRSHKSMLIMKQFMRSRKNCELLLANVLANESIEPLYIVLLMVFQW